MVWVRLGDDKLLPVSSWLANFIISLFYKKVGILNFDFIIIMIALSIEILG